ncbi:hypothetical protein OFN42_42570, partial [Escherichia coli]|nr:hypothetical protein [Escherichia coli]
MLAAIAVAVSLSFIISAPLNRLGHKIYQHSGKLFPETAAEKLNQRDQFITPGHAQVLILGMRRLGTGAYDELRA